MPVSMLAFQLFHNFHSRVEFHHWQLLRPAEPELALPSSLHLHCAEPVEILTGPKGASLTSVCFGGADMKTLFITESTSGSVLKADMSIAGPLPKQATAVGCEQQLSSSNSRTPPDTNPAIRPNGRFRNG